MKDFIDRLRKFIKAYREGWRLLCLDIPSEEHDWLYVLYSKGMGLWIGFHFLPEKCWEYHRHPWGLLIEWPLITVKRPR